MSRSSPSLLAGFCKEGVRDETRVRKDGLTHPDLAL